MQNGMTESKGPQTSKWRCLSMTEAPGMSTEVFHDLLSMQGSSCQVSPFEVHTYLPSQRVTKS